MEICEGVGTESCENTLILMANPEHLAKLNEGVDAWNRWRAENQQVTVDLSEADLAGKDLTGADLQSALLPHANLRGTKLRHGTLLWKADLQQSDICEADLGGADLKGVNFAEADLFKASLRGADLQSADLSSVKGGLRTEQLAGADLTGAKLPEQLKKLYDGLENVKGISESARKIFLAVLAACLYCWLTIATTTDVNLITNRASSPLPIIQTAIPIVGFYVVAPLLVLCVYFYFHFYLQKLWEELGSLPAVFPDGRPLHAKVDPWLLNDLVRAHLPKLNVDRPFLSYFQLWISVLLAWWVVPITMFLFWGRYLRRHEPIGTTFHVVLLVISSVAAVCLYQLAVATLQGTERNKFEWKLALRSRRGYQIAAFAVVAGVLFGLVSWGAIWGVPYGKEIWDTRQSKFGPARGPRTWVPVSMAFVGYPPFANLDGEEVSQRNSVLGARLRNANLRYSSAQGAFLGRADLQGAELSGANLSGANLQGAKLNFGDFSGARLVGADLTNAELAEVNFSQADMAGAHLSGADLRFSTLGADLQQADLSSADLRRANLSGANLMGANLRNAKLAGANLQQASVYFCNFSGAVDLEVVRQASHWDQNFYDEKTRQALGLPSDHNEKLAKQWNELHPAFLFELGGRRPPPPNQ